MKSQAKPDLERRLAVLIDADNAQPSVIEGLLGEIARFGVASVKRIYGDWTSTHHQQWKQVLLGHSIAPVQQFAYTRGKNSTDSALIIDAMDLMYTRRFDGFCLVSSDSDFTRLAQRLREEGLMVFGFGERKTPESFVAACDKFVYTEVLRLDAPRPPPPAIPLPVKASPSKVSPAKAGPAKKQPAAAIPLVGSSVQPAPGAAVRPPERAQLPLELIARAIVEESDESGWASLAAVGSYLTKVRPGFDPRLYGHRKLSDLLRNDPAHFAIEDRSPPGSSTKSIFVRAL